MEKVVDIQAYRAKAFKERVFGPWQKRFDESFDIEIRLSGLSDKILYFLAQPGENSSAAYYELIMGILDLGRVAKFNYLSNKEQMRVVDIHLFLADQVRFEIMRRLKWLSRHPCKIHGLVHMVQDFDAVKAACKVTPPELAASHPDYDAYCQLAHSDKEVFIRRMLRDALETFKERLAPS
jgi:hypothetical protein